VPEGHRAYAVGDIHGRFDLLEDMLGQIEADAAGHNPQRIILVFLGDLIDRGPASCEVIDRLRNYRPGFRIFFLTGNHEEVLLRVLAGERGILSHWLKFGGSECMLSYGVDPGVLQRSGEREGQAIVERAIPADHQKFIASFDDTLRFGDYLFVHAGIRPKVDLSLQLQSDLRWIRQPFLDDVGNHGFVVVHGHTIEDRVVSRPNRIGIDTGAYRTGVLTAAVLEGSERRFLSTAGDAGGSDVRVDFGKNAPDGTFFEGRAY
jgi:serine/threonine protein phosphatase 1